MTRTQIIMKAIENNEVALDVAGLILTCDNSYIKKALRENLISLDLAGQLLLASEI